MMAFFCSFFKMINFYKIKRSGRHKIRCLWGSKPLHIGTCSGFAGFGSVDRRTLSISEPLDWGRGCRDKGGDGRSSAGANFGDHLQEATNGAQGIATIGAPGIATRSMDTTSNKGHRY